MFKWRQSQSHTCAMRRRQGDELDQLGRLPERIGQGPEVIEELELQGAWLSQPDKNCQRNS